MTTTKLPPTLQLPAQSTICSSCAQSPSLTCFWCSSSDELVSNERRDHGQNLRKAASQQLARPSLSVETDQVLSSLHEDTRLLCPEDNQVAMTFLEAGPSRSSTSSSAGLRSRSRSLFSLSLSSRSSHTTAPMISVARTLTRRLSSTNASVTDSNKPTILATQSVHDNDSDDNPTDPPSSLRRKKRLNAAPNIPVPPPNSKLVSRKVSRASLKGQAPIAISLRPGTADSATSSSHRDTSPQREPGPEEEEQQAPQAPQRTVRWSVDEKRDAPNAPSPNGSSATTPTSTTAPPITLSPPPPVPSSNPKGKVGTPGRPYYSAIRKHCVSTPARPGSADGPAPPQGPRPIATSVHANTPPPSAFAMSVSPFTRRPVSMGAVASSSSTGDNKGPTNPALPDVGSGSAGRPSLSVFDLGEDDDIDYEERQVQPKEQKRKSSSLSRAFGKSPAGQGPPSTKEGGGTKKRWSGSLFSSSHSNSHTGSTTSLDPASTRGRVYSNAHQQAPAGISMSGETEMRMTLAAMQDEASLSQGSHHETTPAARDDQRERKYKFRRTLELPSGGDCFGMGLGLGPGSAGASASASSSDIHSSQQQHHLQAYGGVEEGRGGAKRGGLIKKFKMGLKGLLSPTSPSHSSTAGREASS